MCAAPGIWPALRGVFADGLETKYQGAGGWSRFWGVRGGLKPWFFFGLPRGPIFVGSLAVPNWEKSGETLCFGLGTPNSRGVGVLELWCFHMHQFQIRSIHGCARGPDVNPLRPMRVRWKMWFGWSTRWGCEFPVLANSMIFRTGTYFHVGGFTSFSAFHGCLEWWLKMTSRLQDVGGSLAGKATTEWFLVLLPSRSAHRSQKNITIGLKIESGLKHNNRIKMDLSENRIPYNDDSESILGQMKAEPHGGLALQSLGFGSLSMVMYGSTANGCPGWTCRSENFGSSCFQSRKPDAVPSKFDGSLIECFKCM